MKVIYKEPGCAPEVRDIPNTLEGMQDAVGGYIEAVTISKDAAIICNEEGRLMGMPHNMEFLGVDFVGPILIVGVAGDEFTDLRGDERQFLLKSLRKSHCAEVRRKYWKQEAEADG